MPEIWLQGPLPGVPPLLQPVAHALLQSAEEVAGVLSDFPDHLLWIRPGGVASVGFHLQHMAGVLDRMVTYSNGNQLNEIQLASLSAEGINDDQPAQQLVDRFQKHVASTIDVLMATDERKLTEVRNVGRKQLPSTLIGLYVHAAEHTMRHTGQLLVTARIVKADPQIGLFDR